MVEVLPLYSSVCLELWLSNLFRAYGGTILLGKYYLAKLKECPEGLVKDQRNLLS
jgi:hypothetical protein